MKSPSEPRLEKDPLRNRWVAVCDKCDYVGPSVSDWSLAYRILDRHCKSRRHTTNIPPHRAPL